MTFWPVGIDEEWHERLKQRLMDRIRLRQRAAHAEARVAELEAAYDEREALLERIRGDGIRLIAAYDAQAREIERLRTEVERLRDATTVE